MSDWRLPYRSTDASGEPDGRQEDADTPGDALNAALTHLGRRGDVVVIVEPLP